MYRKVLTMTSKHNIFIFDLEHRWAQVLGQGGFQHQGCPQKKFPAAEGGRKIFSPAPPPGGEKFFSVGCLFSRPGGDFAKKMEKMASPGGQNFFFPGCFAPRGAPPPCFFRAGCRAIFARHAWVHPPHPHPVPIYVANKKLLK